MTLSKLVTILGVALTLAADTRLPEADSKEPGPSWDPRPAWQRATDGAWRSVFRRRAVEQTVESEIVPVAGNKPFRIPRAMTAVPVEVAPQVTPLTDSTPGRLTESPCRKEVNHLAAKSTPAEEKQFVAKLQQVMEVIRRNPLFPPPGFEVKMSCGYERRHDGSGAFQGRIAMLFYPYSDKNHYWHGGLEIHVNDLGLMGPRNNAGDRMTDPDLVYSLPASAAYRGHPYLSNEHGSWGGIYLTKHAERLFRYVTYREWIAENLSKFETEYRERAAAAEASPTVRNQVVRRNFQSLYERTLITSQRMPATELDSPVWIADLAPSDAMNPDAARQVRLNIPGYFDKRLPAHAIQLINVMPLHGKYNHLHAVLAQLDFGALEELLQ